MGKGSDSWTIEPVINVSAKPDRVQELINLIEDDDEIKHTVQNLHDADTFPLRYDVCEETGVKNGFPDPGYDASVFKSGATVAVECQIYSRNFKASKKSDAVKAYSFRLLGLYLLDEPRAACTNVIDSGEAPQRGR